MSIIHRKDHKPVAWHLPRVFRALWPPVIVILGVITVFWKLALTSQYTFVAGGDLANMVVPRLQPAISAIRHGSIFLWNPYEWFGEPPIGQVQPGITSPFTYLLALAPLQDGQIQLFWVYKWFVALHCIAGLFAWRFLRDLGCSVGPAAIGGILFATMGYYGNTGWPNNLEPAIMAPLVFLFLLRSLRGQAPLKNAAWGGVMLGISWLCGHHDPPLIMTLFVIGIGIAAAVRNRNWKAAAIRMAIFLGVMTLVSALQILPAIEYGKLSTRWTGTEVLTWHDTVQFFEHEEWSLRPSDLLHVAIPGANNVYSDPFVGILGLSLAAIAVWSGFKRKEVRLFTVLAITALLYAMARYDALYGPLYALAPLVEKAREPIVAVFLFQLAVVALAAIGAEILFLSPDPARDHKMVRALVWFGAGIFVLAFALNALKPAVNSTYFVDGDPRPIMSAFLALLLAGVYQAWSRGAIRREWGLALVGLLVVIEQGQQVGGGWVHVRDTAGMALVNNLTNTRDLNDWLKKQPDPKRIEKTTADVPFNFGDWYEMDSGSSYGASMLTQTASVGWADERMGRMFGMNYVLSRTSPRPGLQDVFTGKTGIKIWYDPGAFPRAWTAHQVVIARDEARGAGIVHDPNLDLRTTAITVGTGPELDSCGGADNVTSIVDQTMSLRVNVDMACKGLLVVSDSWYPGWRARVDGELTEIWRVNTAIRGVVVPAGRHTITMHYSSFSVYAGLACAMAGLAIALVLQKRKEGEGPDIL